MTHPTADDVTTQPSEGWHCLHLFYRWDRAALRQLSGAELAAGSREFCQILDPAGPHAPLRLQTGITTGHKADWGIVALDPDPLKLDAIKNRLARSPLGHCLQAVYSYVSLTEVSEYVPTVEQYAERLVAEGETAGSPAYNAKVKAYESREGMMRQQRLQPDLPPWTNVCFYPMNKWRVPGANWYTLPFAERAKLMAEHGRSGMAFGGKVTQLITVGIGLDDWEWGVTLWARNPEFLKHIVYKMRFDEASAKYAEFGPFYTLYLAPPEKIWEHGCGGER
ncbi:MAG: hydrogen peroxide-dependent heme synthase [Pirellulales bacterium]|nr:hydrogen peroxide-dependent heme synthase [Pirellulales bacterium]